MHGPVWLRVLVVSVLIGLAGDVGRAEHVEWLEAERFDEKGGWVNDPQFIDQMGSPYLLANGRGEPVDDATTTVALPADGRYRLWVRSKDWLPEYHPGPFQVLVDGKAVGMTFGRSGRAGWHWEDGGVHDLAGSVSIALCDLSGYCGRCDVVMLTADLDFVPPDDVAGIAALRVEHGGVSPWVELMPEHDVVVVGGGLAGCTAAVAAARNGCRVALIQNRPVLGGNASTEILVPPVGAWAGIFQRDYPLDPRETGLIEEYRTAGNQRVAEGKLYSKRLLRWVALEPNLDLHLNTHATGVTMNANVQGRIVSVLAVDVETGQRLRFTGRVFIDCTGDSVIGVAAGAEYRHGKEPKSMHDEPWAPEVASRETMGNGLKHYARKADSPQPFEAPPWIYSFPKCEDFGPGRHPVLTTSIEIQGQWKNELGGLRDTYVDAEEIRDDLFRLVYGLWDHTKNHCERDRHRATNYQLVWVGHVAGKRENRRLMGDYVLTQNDIARQTMFPDRVAFGGWSVDDHYSAGFFHDGPTGRHYDGADHHYKGVPFSIPFRCLYSRNVDNLMMAGRNISASHLGMSNTRVMLTCAILGHAAGTGAAFCVHEAITPRDVWRDHLDALQQQLLKEGAAVLDMPNRDPVDLARQARASASSHRIHESGDPMVAENVINGHARSIGRRLSEKTNAWRADPEAIAPHWVELTWPEPVAFDVVHVTFQTAGLAPRQFVVEAWQDEAWKPIAEVTDNRHRRHVLGLERITTSKLRVVPDKPAGICEIRVYDEPEDVVVCARRAHHNMRLPDQGPWLEWSRGIIADKLEGLVIDASRAERVGPWISSTWSTPFIDDGYLHDGDTDKGAKSIRFDAGLPKSGTHEVRLAFVAHSNRATNTPITIRAADGLKTLSVDQRQRPPIDGLFLSLGTFDFDEHSSIVITTTDTDGYVVVDAVQLIPAGRP